jgi:hypothetical protein
MKDRRERNPKKKPYVKPEVKQVQLKPEEAVLGFCKNAVANGPGDPADCTPVGNCSGIGS